MIRRECIERMMVTLPKEIIQVFGLIEQSDEVNEEGIWTQGEEDILFKLDWELNWRMMKRKMVGPYIHKLGIELIGHTAKNHGCRHRRPGTEHTMSAFADRPVFLQWITISWNNSLCERFAISSTFHRGSTTLSNLSEAVSLQNINDDDDPVFRVHNTSFLIINAQR